MAPITFERHIVLSRSSNDPKIDKIVNDLASKLCLGVKYHDTLKRVALDLVAAYHQHPSVKAIFPRGRNGYSIPGSHFYEAGVSYLQMMAVVGGLVRHGLAEAEKGTPTTKKASTMCATPNLVHLFGDAWIKQSYGPNPLVVMKDEEKARIDCMLSDELRTMMREVNDINVGLQRHIVNIDLAPEDLQIFLGRGELPPDRTRNGLYRVFNNNSFEDGGRFYGHWVQGLPKDLRPKVTIDGEPTVELDYSALHPHLLYIRETGAPFHTYPYHIDGIDTDFAKAAVNTMLNAKTENAAVGAICQKSPQREEAWVKLAIREILSVHRRIARHFNTGIGVKLQNQDSRMALQILSLLMAWGLPCIPVHDSFIVRVSDMAALWGAMRQAALDQTGCFLPIADATKTEITTENWVEMCAKAKEAEGERGRGDIYIYHIGVPHYNESNRLVGAVAC